MTTLWMRMKPKTSLRMTFSGAGPSFHKFPTWGCPTLPGFLAGGWALAGSTTSVRSRLRAIHYDSISTIPSVPVISAFAFLAKMWGQTENVGTDGTYPVFQAGGL